MQVKETRKVNISFDEFKFEPQLIYYYSSTQKALIEVVNRKSMRLMQLFMVFRQSQLLKRRSKLAGPSVNFSSVLSA